MSTHTLSKSCSEPCQSLLVFFRAESASWRLSKLPPGRGERLALQEISVSLNQPFAQRHRVLPAKRGQSTCVQKFSWSTVGFRSVKYQASSESHYFSDKLGQFPHSQVFTATDIE